MHPGEPRPAARLTALYEAHSADTFRYALYVTGRREDAEDVVQFVFLQAYALLESGRDLVNPRAWLIKATKHRSLNVIRDRRALPSPDLPAAASYDPDPAEAEALAGVRAALWTLPESQHHAFVLRHWSGLSQDEIADVLSTTPGAVESLLVRARMALLQERQEGAGECAGVRRRLAGALALSGDQSAHVSSCRRCRTARTRLLRASEFATAFTLLPRPHVAHAIASAVPGFGTSTLASAATATGATGGLGGGAAGAAGGGGAGAATASVATKVTVLAKVAVAAATAVVAVGAAHPVRSAVAGVVLGGRTAQPASSAANGAAGAAAAAGAVGTTGEPVTPGSPGASSNGSASGPGQGNAKGKTAAAGASGTSNGKSSTAGSNGNGNGQSAGAANGKTHGKSATAGSNGKSATAGSTGKSATAGSNGKSATAGSNGKSATAGSNGASSGQAGGTSGTSGKGKAGGSAGSSGTPGSAGNGKGNGKS